MQGKDINHPAPTVHVGTGQTTRLCVALVISRAFFITDASERLLGCVQVSKVTIATITLRLMIDFPCWPYDGDGVRTVKQKYNI